MTTAVVTPHNLEAEKSVLGAILISPDRLFDLDGRLAAEDFFRDAHRRIYDTLLELAAEHQTIDLVTLKDRLAHRGTLEEIGGPAYLAGMTAGVPCSMNVAAYAAIVRDAAERRRLQAAIRQIAAEAENPDLETRMVIDHAERAIFAVAERRAGGDFIDADALVAQGIPAIEKLLETKGNGVTGVSTGFADLDAMSRGLQRQDLVIIAARPSVGKTALALNIAFHAATHGRHVGFFSLEMSSAELFMRTVASVGRIDGHRLQSGYINQADYSRLAQAFSEIGESTLHVDDSADLGVLELRGKVRRLKARCGLDLVIVDYLQLMRLGRAENRNLAIADVSRSLKLLAREMDVPVVALSQLSRETERREGKRPMLSDLRDSGALEQDADLVVFIHRPEMYQATADNAGVAEIVIAKQRNGPTGTVKLRWAKESTRFDNLESTRA